MENIPVQDYDFICGYLTSQKLFKTSMMCAIVDESEMRVPNNEITKDGINIVESFIDKCISKIEKTYDVFFHNSLSYFDKIKQLYIVWNGNSNLYDNACELLVSILWNINYLKKPQK